MANSNMIGMEESVAFGISEKLNVLLADYQVYYQNLRGFHWNIQGNRFFSLHEKFEELYLSTAEVIDEIAERILTLGHVPLHTFNDYVATAHLKAQRVFQMLKLPPMRWEKI